MNYQDNARTITAALGGKWYGRYGLACCPAHGDRKPSLSLSDAPNGRLLAHCKIGCAFADVLDALRGMGLVEGHGHAPMLDPVQVARRQAEEQAAAEKRAHQAQAYWSNAVPVGGTVAERYLRGRGITCPLPNTLRFHPDCWHGATARRLPAMVALIQGSDRCAIHRTYLRPDGSGKADVEPNKAMLGRTVGGAVRVAGSQGPLVVAEGIETALSLCSGLLHRPATVWAALSNSGLRGLRLPSAPHALIVATDSDDKGAGLMAGNALAERAAALGWTVSLLPCVSACNLDPLSGGIGAQF